MSFEVLEHTADIGFRATGATFPDLLAEAARALVSIAIDLDSIEPREPYPIAAKGEDREALLVNWLSEVLYYLDGRRIGLSRFEMEHCSSTAAAGLAFGEPRTMRHESKLIVKGVTYHLLRIEESATGFSCEVYLDI